MHVTYEMVGCQVIKETRIISYTTAPPSGHGTDYTRFLYCYKT